jgi:hypothetical protein
MNEVVLERHGVGTRPQPRRSTADLLAENSPRLFENPSVRAVRAQP